MRAGILIYHPKLNNILESFIDIKMDNVTTSFQVKLEESESPIEVAIREIKEEVQLTLGLSQKT